MTWYGMTRYMYDIIWYDIVSWHDMISYSMASYHIWYDMIYDMIWYDIWYHMGTSCLGYELSWVRVVLGTSCLGYELSWVRIVLGTSCLGYELSWVRVVLGTSCPDPTYKKIVLKLMVYFGGNDTPHAWSPVQYKFCLTIRLKLHEWPQNFPS